jgi:Kelch motif
MTAPCILCTTATHEYGLSLIRHLLLLPLLPNKPQYYRFCHVACVCKDSMLVFGGYDGTSRLNDLLEFKFGVDLMCCEIPQSTLVPDLRSFVNSEVCC